MIFHGVVEIAWARGLVMGLGADPTSLLVECGKKKYKNGIGQSLVTFNNC